MDQTIITTLMIKLHIINIHIEELEKIKGQKGKYTEKRINLTLDRIKEDLAKMKKNLDGMQDGLTYRISLIRKKD